MEDSTASTVTEVESLCFACHKTGSTKFMLTVIPYFREVVISAFECPHCGFKNTGIQSASQIAERGVQYEILVRGGKDLSRQIVKSEFASIKLPEVDLELPSKSGTGYLTTVEGLIGRILGDMQAAREGADEEATKTRLGEIIATLGTYLEGNVPFSILLDDITGNSFVENFCAPRADPHLKELRYRQDPALLSELGFATLLDNEGEVIVDSDDEDVENVHSFRTKCPECLVPCKTRMTMVEIPYFKEVLLMATTCDACGYKTNEVKTGGAISERGRRITLKLTGVEDLSRDILKSDSCSLRIPEIDLELHMGTLGGRFTTIEGLLTQVRNELEERVDPFAAGDSAGTDKKAIFGKLLDNLRAICEGKLPCTVILEDPLANSHIQNLYAPDPDPNMVVEDFQRTLEQDEDLGISEMKVENYEAV